MDNMNQNYNNQLSNQQTVYQYPNDQPVYQGYSDNQPTYQGGYYPQQDGQTVYQYPNDQQMGQGGYYPQADGQTVYQYPDDQQTNQGRFDSRTDDWTVPVSVYPTSYPGADEPQIDVKPADKPKKNINSKVIIGIVFSFVAVAIITVAVVFLLSNSSNSDYKDKLELATKYLNEQDFEEAEVAFLAAIEIDPKNQDAYIGLANTYAAMGDEYFYNQPLSVDDYGKMLDYYNKALTVLSESKMYFESDTVEVMIGNIEKKCTSIDRQKEELEEETRRAEEEARKAAEEEARRLAEEEAYANSFEGIREELINQYGYGYNIGQIMPDFSFSDLNGNIVNLSDFLGRPLYINAFTTWCPYCDMEVGDMQATYNKYADKIDYIMIDLGETADEVRSYARRFGLNIPMYILPEWSFGDYNIDGVPTTFVLDKYGRIVNMTVGMASADWILSATEDAIAASED